MSRNEIRREVAKPTLKPRGLHFFLHDYEIVANANFGDVATYVFTGEKPDYIKQNNFKEYAIANLGVDDEEAMAECDAEEVRLIKKRWFSLRSEYEDKLKKMFHDVMLHVSDESMNLIQSFPEDYSSCIASKDPADLIKIIRKSHTQAGRVASREEKELARDKLKSHRQWDKSGKVYDIHDHNRMFRTLLDDTKEVGIMWEDEDLVDLYLRSVDSTLFEADLARIKVPGSSEMPKTLEDAMHWVIDTNRTNKMIKENRPQAKSSIKRKAEGDSHVMQAKESKRPMYQDTAETPECTFCSKKHFGGAQNCAYLKQHLSDYPEEVKKTLAKKVSYPSGNRQRSFKRGGKGGRGRGRGRRGGKGRGFGGRSGDSSGNSQSVRLTDNSESTSTALDSSYDDTWTDFHKDQLISESYDNYHLEVTVFKNGRARMSQKQEKLLYLYDNGATCNLFCNETLMWDVQDIMPTLINGVGNVWVTRRGMSMFGPAFILPQLPFNIVAEQEITARDHVIFDSQKSPHYFVNGVQWNRDNKSGLLTCSHEDARKMVAGRAKSTDIIQQGEFTNYCDQYALALEALPDGTYYNAQQRRRAAEVKRIHDILNHPSDEVLGVLFDRGSISGCPYTSRDVRIMRKIYGPCVACVKGKTVRPPTGSVLNKWIAHCPGERLCMDIFFITIISRKNAPLKLPFLVIVDDYTDYTCVQWLPARTTHSVYEALNKVIQFYNSYDWGIREVCGDRDTVFLPLKQLLQTQHVELDIRATDQKIPRADRMIRTLRDILRTIKASLFYKPPQFLYPDFLDDVAKMWNTRPNSRTVDRSPREIVEGKKLHFSQHLKVPVGTIGEFFIPPSQRQSNSTEEREQKKNEERTATGIVIGRNLDPTGTLDIYNIESGTRVNRCKVKLIRKPSDYLKTQLRKITPRDEIDDDDMYNLVDKLTSSTSNSNKRTISSGNSSQLDNSTSRNNNQKNDHAHESFGDEQLTDTSVSNKNNNLEQSDNTSQPVCTENNNNETKNMSKDICHDKNDNTARKSAPDDNIETEKRTETEVETSISSKSDNSMSNSNENNMQPLKKLKINEDKSQEDYPKCKTRPRVVERKTRSDNKAVSNQRSHIKNTTVRVRRQTAGKAPSKYDPSINQLSHENADIEKDFQDFIYSASENMTIRDAQTKYPSLYENALIAELKQFHNMKVGKPILHPPSDLKHKKIIGMNGFFKESIRFTHGITKEIKIQNCTSRSLTG